MKKVIIITVLFALCYVTPDILYSSTDSMDVEEMEHRLRTGDFVVKMQIMQQIKKSELPLEDVQRLLASVVRHGDIRLQLYALRVLFEHGDMSVRDVLFSYLSDSNTNRNIKLRVLLLLESLHDEESIYRLKTLIENENDVQVKIALIRTFLTVMPLDEVDKNIITSIQTYLAEESTQIKVRILDFLSSHGEQALSLIQKALDDRVILVRERAFEILSRINTVQVKNTIRPYIKKENSVTVYNAAFALGALGEESYFRFITRDLQSDNKRLRMKALDFLFRRLGHEKDTYFLRMIELIAEKDTDEEMRGKAKRYIDFYNQIHRTIKAR